MQNVKCLRYGALRYVRVENTHDVEPTLLELADQWPALVVFQIQTSFFHHLPVRHSLEIYDASRKWWNDLLVRTCFLVLFFFINLNIKLFIWYFGTVMRWLGRLICNKEVIGSLARLLAVPFNMTTVGKLFTHSHSSVIRYWPKMPTGRGLYIWCDAGHAMQILHY